MEATSFWGREGEGAATDKMEETFLSQPSKEKGGGQPDVENYKSPPTISARRKHERNVWFEESKQCFYCGKSCLSEQICQTLYHISKDLMRSACLCDARGPRMVNNVNTISVPVDILYVLCLEINGLWNCKANIAHLNVWLMVTVVYFWHVWFRSTCDLIE